MVWFWWNAQLTDNEVKDSSSDKLKDESSDEVKDESSDEIKDESSDEIKDDIYILQQIIDILNRDDVQKLHISSQELWLEISPLMNKFQRNDNDLVKIFIEKGESSSDKTSDKITDKLSKDGAMIYGIIKNIYLDHYVNNRKMYKLMDRDHSFITQVVMYLHH